MLWPALQGVGSSFAKTASPPDEDGKLYASARKEGKVVWWTAHYALSAAEAVRNEFSAKYPGIEVEFIRQTAQVIYQRLAQNLEAGVREVDVFASTDEAHYLTLKGQGAFAAYTPGLKRNTLSGHATEAFACSERLRSLP